MTGHDDDEPRVFVSAYGRTHRGRVRSENQDSLLVLDLAGGSAEEGGDGGTVGPLEFVLANEGAILLVADGMGGRAGGARASEMAISAVREAMSQGRGTHSSPTTDQFAARLERSLESANAAIHEAGSRWDASHGMGSTATLAGLLNGFVYVAQVGDSRAYLLRNDRIERLTRDQSLVQDLIDSGALSQEQAKGVRNNMISQALGGGPTVSPAMTYHRLRRGDVVMLCSDGLCGVVSDDEIRSIVTESTDGDAICEELIGLANQRGGPDNITVLLAQIDGAGIAEAQETDTVCRHVYEGT